MAKERTCAFCNTPEQKVKVSASPMKGTFERSNLVAIARGLLACTDCAKVHESGRKSRAANIAKLKDLPISSPQWGRFLESRKS